ncbi:hypothetical protein J6590_102177, partial [Homalodisca vitripennis]
MPPPVAANTYTIVLDATKEVSAKFMKQAVLDEINETEETETQAKTDISDGTWMRRGHNS